MARLILNRLKLLQPCLTGCPSRNWVVLIAIGLLTVLVAWPAIFSTLALYDDEGYVMMTLQTYMQGHRLYGETHTQYGPAFYYMVAPLHSLLQWPLTQTGIRIKTVLVWVIAVWFCFSIVRRLSGSASAGAATALLAVLQLDKLTLEPGHPQEMTLLGTLLILLLFSRSKFTLATVHPDLLSISSWLVVGFVTGIVGLIKLNCGLVIAIPLLLTAAVQSPGIRPFRWGLPFIAWVPALAVAWFARSEPHVSLWALWLGTCAAWMVYANVSTWDSVQRRSNKHLLVILLAGLLAVILVIGLALRQGISASELWMGIVGQHSAFADYFFVPIGLSFVAFLGWLTGIAGLVLPRLNFFKTEAKFVIWLWVALSLAITALLPLQHGLNPRGAGLLLAWAAPGWIIWMWREDSVHSPKKLFLALVAILSPLIAFPVSGTQVQIGTLPSLIVIGILLGEYLVETARAYSGVESTLAMAFRPISNRLVLASTISIVLATSITHWIRYAQNHPLDLPGSTWMRLPVSLVHEQREIVDAIQRSGASHLLFEGKNHNRFHFWTGLKPLTSANPTFWPLMLLHDERRRLADAIDRESHLCVVRVPQYEWLYFDHASEIRERIETRWQLSESVNDWQIGIAQ